ncbi:MAG: lysophospholipid acyltransferase family protein [Actinomycetota bacterium]
MAFTNGVAFDAELMFGRVERSQRRLQKLTQPVATRLWDIETVGFDRIPADGPAILCPNHISFLDSAFLMLTTERTIGFLGKAEYMDSWKTKHLFPAMGMIPVDRSGGKNSMDALRAALDVLESGGLMGIFPEGTRSRTGDLHKGRTGAARLALSVGCPVVPVGITGTDRIQPPDAPMPALRGSARIEIGEPVDPARFVDLPGPKAARALTDEVMYEIRELTGQEYRNHYAGERPVEQRPERVTVPPLRRTSPLVGDAVDRRQLVGVG